MSGLVFLSGRPLVAPLGLGLWGIWLHPGAGTPRVGSGPELPVLLAPASGRERMCRTASPGSCAGPRWGHEDTGVRPQIPLRVLCSEIVSGSGSHTGCAGGAGVAGAGKVGAHGLPDAVLCSTCPSKGAARGPTCWPWRSLGLEHHLTEKQVGEAAQSQDSPVCLSRDAGTGRPRPGGAESDGSQRQRLHFLCLHPGFPLCLFRARTEGTERMRRRETPPWV